MGFIIPAAAILAAKAGKAYFGSKAKKKANVEDKRAETAALTLQQKQREDARRARLDLGASMLNGVPATTAGGGVNTNVGLDPELVKRLGLERTYDFGSAIPDRNKGAGSAFLAGLFGDVGDTIASMYGPGGMAMGGSSKMPLYNATDAWNSPGGAYHGGMPTSAPLHMVGGDSGVPGLSWEDLYRQQAQGAE